MKQPVLMSFAVTVVLSFGAQPCQALLAFPGQDPQVPEIVVPKRPALPPDFGGKGPAQSGPKVARFDPAQAHRDAQQLAALAQKIPQQVDELSKNALPKDLIQNLKQIQKLAKRLRSEIGQ